jgi:hypothetical protein
MTVGSIGTASIDMVSLREAMQSADPTRDMIRTASGQLAELKPKIEKLPGQLPETTKESGRDPIRSMLEQIEIVNDALDQMANSRTLTTGDRAVLPVLTAALSWLQQKLPDIGKHARLTTPADLITAMTRLNKDMTALIENPALRLTEQFILLDARVLLGKAAALGPKMTALERETSEQFESELAVNVDALGKKVAGRSI